MSTSIDPRRLQRALALEIQKVNSNQYLVQGTEEDYYVRIAPTPICCCPDAAYRNALCKHLLAGMLAAGVPEVVQAASSLTSAETIARRMRRELPYDLEFPKNVALSELLGLLEINPNDRQLAGRILTDPRTQTAHWRRLAEIVEIPEIRYCLANIPDAAQDDQVRANLLQHGADVGIIFRLMPYATSAELSEFIRFFLKEGREAALLAVLEENTNDVLSRVQPRDLLPLFTHEKAEIRERTVLLLSKMKRPGQQREIRGPAMDPRSVRLH